MGCTRVQGCTSFANLRSTPFHFFDAHDEMYNPGCLEEDAITTFCFALSVIEAV